METERMNTMNTFYGSGSISSTNKQRSMSSIRLKNGMIKTPLKRIQLENKFRKANSKNRRRTVKDLE